MKRAVLAILLLILTFSLSMAAQLPNYTLADVANTILPPIAGWF